MKKNLMLYVFVMGAVFSAIIIVAVIALGSVSLFEAEEKAGPVIDVPLAAQTDPMRIAFYKDMYVRATSEKFKKKVEKNNIDLDEVFHCSAQKAAQTFPPQNDHRAALMYQLFVEFDVETEYKTKSLRREFFKDEDAGVWAFKEFAKTKNIPTEHIQTKEDMSAAAMLMIECLMQDVTRVVKTKNTINALE